MMDTVFGLGSTTVFPPGFIQCGCFARVTTQMEMEREASDDEVSFVVVGDCGNVVVGV